MLQKVTAGLPADNYPDVAYIYGSDLANLVRSPKLADLTDAMKGDGWNWDDVYPAAREATTVNGRVRAAPALIDNLAVVYNKKIFEQAGVPEPQDDWTWDDFRATAKRMTDKSKGIAGFGWPGIGDEDTTWRIWPLIWQPGGDIVSEDGNSVGFDGPAAAGADADHDMATDDNSVYIDSKAGSEQMHQLFAAARWRWTSPARAAAGVRDAEGRLRGRPDAVVRRRAHDDRGPGHLDGARQRQARKAAAIEFLDWFSRARAARVWDQNRGQPAADASPRAAAAGQSSAQRHAGDEGSSTNTERARPAGDPRSIRRSARRWARRSPRCSRGGVAAGALSRRSTPANTGAVDARPVSGRAPHRPHRERTFAPSAVRRDADGLGVRPPGGRRSSSGSRSSRSAGRCCSRSTRRT